MEDRSSSQGQQVCVSDPFLSTNSYAWIYYRNLLQLEQISSEHRYIHVETHHDVCMYLVTTLVKLLLTQHLKSFKKQVCKDL
jgi:hypothetical protein